MGSNAVVETLSIVLGLDTTQLDAGIAKSNGKLNKFIGDVQKSAEKTSGAKITPDNAKVGKELNNLSKMFGYTASNILRTFVAPLMSAFASGKIVSTFAQQADEIGRFAQKMRVNGEELQVWARAAENAGGSAESLKRSVVGLQEKINFAAEVGRRGFAMSGRVMLRTVNADGSKRDAFDVLRDLADKSKTMNESQFNLFASQLGIDKDTVQLLKLGGEELDKMLKRQREIGVYTKEDFETARKFNNTLRDMRQALSMVAAVIARVLVRPLTWLADKFTDIVVYLRQHEYFVQAFFIGLATVITATTIPAFIKLAIALAPVLAALAAIAAVALVVEDFLVWFSGGDSLLGDSVWSKLGPPEELRKKWEKLKEVMKSLIPIVLYIAQCAMRVLTLFGMLKAISAIDSTITLLIGRAKTLAKTLSLLGGIKFGSLKSALSTVGKGLLTVGKSALVAGKALLVAIGPVGWAIMAIIASLILLWWKWDDVKKIAGKCADYITQKWNAIKSWWSNICKSISSKWAEIWTNMKQKVQEKIDAIKGMVPDWLKNLVSGDGKVSVEVEKQGETGTAEKPISKAFTSVTPYSDAFGQVLNAQTQAPALALGYKLPTWTGQTVNTDYDQNITINIESADDPQAIADSLSYAFRPGGELENAARNLQSGNA